MWWPAARPQVTTDEMAGVVHYGSICTQGLNCNTSMPAGNRELAEYSELTHDPLGLIHMAFSEDDLTSGTAFTLVFQANRGAGPDSECGQRRRLLQHWQRHRQPRLPRWNEVVFGHSRGDAELSGHFRAHLPLGTNGFNTVKLGTNTVTVTGTGVLQDGSERNLQRDRHRGCSRHGLIRDLLARVLGVGNAGAGTDR